MSNVPRASREMGGLEKEEEEHGKDGRDVEVVSEESGGELFSGPLGEKALAHASESLSSRSTTSSEEDHSSLDGEEKGGFVKNHQPKDFSAGMEMMMKERFAKLLLGEDMSGCGKGVSTALTISNSITNLCATIFGQVWRLEPLPSEKKAMWKREMDWLLCVSDHIVELTPSWQTLADGRKLEVMACRPRSDLFINLPALKKLDNILLEILDSFSEPEFWYIERGIVATMDSNDSSSICRQEEKWWLPVPQVPSGGLQEKSRKHLEHKRESVSQILKAVMAINSNILAEMDVPDSYLESLPKNGRASLGDLIHRYITSDQFSPDCLLDCLDLSSEHQALEIANRVEAATFIWRRRAATRPPTNNPNRTTSRTSWGGVVRDFMGDVDKRELLAGRAESLLISLKQRFPRLSQTSLDTSKIQYNKDIGKSILESYSRVLESLAFNIVARIDELLHVDDVMKQPTTGDSNKLAIVPKMAAVVAHKRGTIPSAAAYSVPPSSTTPYATAYATPCFSPAPLGSLNRSPMANRRSNARGFGVKKVLTDYLGVDVKAKASVEHQQGRMKLRTNEERGKVLPSN